MTTNGIVKLAAAAALSAGLLAGLPGTAAAESGQRAYRLDANAGAWGTVASEERARASRSAAATRQAGGAAPSQDGVFRSSYTLAQFEQLTGVTMSKTFGSRTWFSHFRGRPTLAEDGYNFYVNRNNGRIVFRSLSGADSPFSFASVFVEVGSRDRTDVAFNWSTPRALRINGFPRGPVPVSLN